MTSICTSVPTINNGKFVPSGTNAAEYECLSGFQLVGSKVVNCDATSGWDTVPKCEVINTSDNILTWGPEWLLVLVAIILILLVLSCVGCAIWACCCKRRDQGILCFGGSGDGGDNGRGRGENEYSDDSNLMYNENAGVYTMADGTMFIPVRPLHQGDVHQGGFHRRQNTEEEVEDPGYFNCCNRRRTRRPSADMVYDETEGIYTLKDGTMYTPIKPQKTNDPDDKQFIWRNNPDTESKNWFTHQGVFAGEINGQKAGKYDSKDVNKFIAADYKSNKGQGHWFLDDPKDSNNNRTTLTTTLRDSVQKPNTVYILDEDPRLTNTKQKSRKTPEPIMVQSSKYIIERPGENSVAENVQSKHSGNNSNTVVGYTDTNAENNNTDKNKDKDKDKSKKTDKDDELEEKKNASKSKTEPKIVVINVTHKGRSKPRNNAFQYNRNDDNKDIPVPKTDNFLTKSLPPRGYTPSETGTRDTFSLIDVEDLIATHIHNGSSLDRSTDDDETMKINPDSRFVDAVNKELILEKMRKKRRNDKVWIPHSHPIRNSKHFTK